MQKHGNQLHDLLSSCLLSEIHRAVHSNSAVAAAFEVICFNFLFIISSCISLPLPLKLLNSGRVTVIITNSYYGCLTKFMNYCCLSVKTCLCLPSTLSCISSTPS